VEAGKIRYYGVSVERVEEALKAIEFPHVQTVQIIFKLFPPPAATCSSTRPGRSGWNSGAGPAGSGMLTGKLTRNSQFAPTITATSTARRGVRRGRDLFRVDYETRSKLSKRSAVAAAGSRMGSWLCAGF